MPIDLPTLVISAAIANMAMALALALVIHGQPKALHGSLPVWTRGIALLALGWFFIGFRGEWPDIIALVGANGLLAFGMAECCDSLRRFNDEPRRHRTPYLISILIVLVSILFSYVWPDRYWRLMINTLLLGILFGIAARLAFRARANDDMVARSHLLVASVFALAAIVLFVRVVSVMMSGRDHMPSIDEINLIQGLFYTAATLGPIVATLGYALMCNERLGSELARLANEDGLTGVHNRRSLEQIAQRMLLPERRKNRPFSLILVDADHFKRINDNFGHGAGDLALRELAKILKTATGDMGVVGRFGGEEFLILLPDADIREASLMADRMRQEICSQVLSFSEQKLSWSISAGVAQLDKRDTDFDMLVRRADQALYRAKSEGRNRVALAEELV
ncbi:MAG TPA: GGDEF domain-containing protein [Arenimonas sp.]|nr:GGDEF domain-containing protein [Arenimonas sp.]